MPIEPNSYLALQVDSYGTAINIMNTETKKRYTISPDAIFVSKPKTEDKIYLVKIPAGNYKLYIIYGGRAIFTFEKLPERFFIKEYESVEFEVLPNSVFNFGKIIKKTSYITSSTYYVTIKHQAGNHSLIKKNYPNFKEINITGFKNNIKFKKFSKKKRK